MERLSDYQKAQKWLESIDWDDCPESDDNLATICYALQEIEKYEDLEEQKKILRLPAAIGEEVFFIFRDCPKDFKKEYCTDHKGSCENCHHRVSGISTKVFSLQDVPYMHIFFGTKEAAEAALKKMSE